MAMSSKLSKFIAPPEVQVMEGTFPPLPRVPMYTLPRTRVPLDQVPPAQAGELPAFQTVSRGSSNVLATEKPCTTGIGASVKCSVRDIWAKGQFGQAPEVMEIDPALLRETDETGTKMKIVRLEPDRFERGRVQRPRMTVEEVNIEDLYGDDERLIHPSKRRWAHDTAVNARLASQQLKEAHLAKSKLAQSCRVNYPHGVVGCKESPYDPEGNTGGVYTNAEQLRKESLKTNRKGRGGQNPEGTIGGLLKGESAAHDTPGKGAGKRMFVQPEGFNIKRMV